MKRPKSLAGPRPRVREVSISAPVAKQRNYVARRPTINGGKAIVVRHREWLEQIVSVQAFTGAGRYIIQPGLSDNFPWLAQLAANFENYEFLKIRYVYRNHIATSGNFSVYVATQYDVNDPEFKSVEEIMNYSGAQEHVCWKDFTFDIKPRRGQLTKKYMVRTDTLPAGLDPVPYDTALFTICGVGSGTAGTYLGDLMVEYEVAFTNPKMNPNLVAASGAWTNGFASNLSSLTTSPFQGMSFVTSVTGDSKGFSEDNMPELDYKTTPVTPTITFPVPGAYSVKYEIGDPGSTATVQASGFTGDANCTVVSSWNNYASAAGKGLRQFCDVITTGPAAKLTMGAITGSGTSASSIVTTLMIACESLNYVLSLFGSSPSPPLRESDCEKLIRCFPKHDTSRIKSHLEKIKRQREFKDMLSERKIELHARDFEIPRRLEVQREDAENSDGDVVEILQPRTRAIDKRSKSSDRKQDDR